MPSETRAGRYAGPPGDTTAYYLPRDMKVWEASWDRYLGETAPLETLDTSRRRGRAEELDMSPEAVAERAEKKRRHAEALAYVASYTGRWGLPLDIRANPRWGTKHMKLSERQVEVLLAGRDRDLERATQAEIARELWQDDVYNHQRESIDQQANRMQRERQDAFLARKEAARVPDTSDTRSRLASPQAPGLAPQPATPPSMGSRGPASPDDGWYVVDGQPWKVQWNRERTRKYAKRLVHGDPAALRESLHPVAPQWEYVPGGLTIIAREGTRMTVEDAVQYGKLYGACAVCGTTLTNEKSIERGIGPICFGRLS